MISEGAGLASRADSGPVTGSFKPDFARQTLGGAPEVDVVTRTAEPTLPSAPELGEGPRLAASAGRVALSGRELTRLTELALGAGGGGGGVRTSRTQGAVPSPGVREGSRLTVLTLHVTLTARELASLTYVTACLSFLILSRTLRAGRAV